MPIRSIKRALNTRPNPLAMANNGVFGLNMLKLFDTAEGRQLLMKSLDEVLEGFQKGEYKATIGRVFPISEVGAAHSYLQARKSTGKVMLRCT